MTGFNFFHANGDFGQIGVNMFWILSGAVLILNYQDNFHICHYYKRRALAILPLYWLTYLLFYTYFTITSGWPPIWKLNPARLLLTVFGIDGYLSSITQTYFLIGEWFTGVLIIIYAIFPLLRYLYLRHFWVSSYCIFLVYLLNLKYQIFSFGNGFFSLSTGIFMFWVGMTTQKFEKQLSKSKPIYFAIPLLMFLFIQLPFFQLAELAVMGLLLYLLIFSLTKNIKIRPKVVGIVCTYSYAIYLVHHQVFRIYFTRYLIGTSLSTTQVIKDFIIQLIIVFAISFALRNIVKYLEKAGRKVFSLIKK